MEPTLEMLGRGFTDENGFFEYAAIWLELAAMGKTGGKTHCFRKRTAHAK
jgi:hypothetical protein